MADPPGASESEAPNETTSTPVRDAPYEARRRLGLRGEFALAALPTATVLIVLAFVEALARQRLLFASLASSAFLIYLDPGHPSNSMRTLLLAQTSAAVFGWGLVALFGSGYVAAASAMVATIVFMIAVDAVHPPAVSTALSFALGNAQTHAIVLFGLALGITVALVLIQLLATRLLARLTRSSPTLP
ncbi:MAG: HPP family protein [Candidatus Eremiobacteraeota bacterium]|nr:HPP family protein [Candidatus Eremiobacteraeota bacterium]